MKGVYHVQKCTHLVVTATLASLTGISGALAVENYPPSVVGVWNAVGNQTPLTLTITSEAGPNKCPVITGTILDGVSHQTQTLSGFYCPESGRIVFAHIPPTGPTTQVYSANLFELGLTTYMGGSFEQTGAGEYGFFAHKP